MKKQTINTFFQIYKEDPTNYEIIVELQQQVTYFITYIINTKAYNNKQLKTDLINECNYEFWKSVSPTKLQNITSNNISAYIKAIINNVIYKKINNNKEDYLSLDDKTIDSNTYIELIEDNKSFEEYNYQIILDSFIDILLEENIPSEHIEWLLLNIEGKTNTEISRIYNVSHSYIARTIKQMKMIIKDKNNNY